MASGVPDGYVEYEPSWERAPIFTSFMTVLGVAVVSLGIAILVYFGSTSFRLMLLTWPVIVGTIVLHESVHVVVSWLLGCEISVGIETRDWWDASPYILSHGMVKTRRQDLAITLAPFLGLNLLALIILAIIGPFSHFGLLVAVGVCMNTFGASWGYEADLPSAYRVWRLPTDVRILDAEAEPRTYLSRASRKQLSNNSEATPVSSRRR